VERPVGVAAAHLRLMLFAMTLVTESLVKLPPCGLAILEEDGVEGARSVAFLSASAQG
jgi:hypothetical protein